MKHFIFITFFSCTILSDTAAQISFWLKPGINYSVIKAKDIDKEPKYGINIGISALYFINNRFAIHSGLRFSQKGGYANAQNGRNSDYFYYTDIKSSYVEIPANLNIYIAKFNKVNIFLNTGFYSGFNIWVTEETRETEDIYRFSDGPVDKNKLDYGLLNYICLVDEYRIPEIDKIRS